MWCGRDLERISAKKVKKAAGGPRRDGRGYD